MKTPRQGRVRFSKVLTAPSKAPITAAGRGRVKNALAYLESFRPAPQPVAIVAGLLPISDDDVLTWVGADLEARQHLSWDMAKALAFIDTFKSGRIRP